MEQEIWKDVKGYEEQYEISNTGKVKNKITGNGISVFIKAVGYPAFSVYNRSISKRRQILIHRALAIAFIPNPENKREVNHINGDKKDYRLSNLEWNTTSENHLHAYRIGLQKPSEKQKRVVSQLSSRRLSKPVLQFDLKGNLIKRYSSATEAETSLGVSKDLVARFCRGANQSLRYIKDFKFSYE